MPQRQGLQHTQQQQQVQNTSSAQVLLSTIVEMPLADFETRLQNELLDNEALEVSETEGAEGNDFLNAEGDDGMNDSERETARMEDELGDYRSLDDVPDTLRDAYSNRGEDNGRERQIGNEDSAYDELYRQIGELSISEHEMAIMVYLVGSLDENGFLSKDDATLCDELAFNEYIDTTPEEVSRLAKLLQQFEPKGIGARNLRECLLLQLAPDAPARVVVDRYFDDLMHSRWPRIAAKLSLSEEDVERIRHDISRLNPRPGSVLSEGINTTAPTVVPDFRVTLDSDGTPIVHQQRGQLPELRVSPAFAETLVMHRMAKDRAAQEC